MGLIPVLGVFNRRNYTTYVHRMVIGSAGSITSQDPGSDSGVVAALNGVAVGQYTLTLTGTGNNKSGMRQYLGCTAVITGPTGATAFGTGGITMFMRDNNIDAGLRNNTCMIQFAAGSPPVATDITSGYTVTLTIKVAT